MKKTKDKPNAQKNKCLWMNPVLHARVKTAAARSNLSFTVWLENAVTEKLQRDGEK